MFENLPLWLCITVIILVIALGILIGIHIYRSLKSDHNNETVIKSLTDAGFDVRDGKTGNVIANASTLTGGSNKRMTSYQTMPLLITLNGGAFEDIIDCEYRTDAEEINATDIYQDEESNDEHIDTLSDYRLSTTNSAKPLSPDEYVLNQARSLTHLDIKHLHVNDYVWLEKTDGVREMYKQNDSILDCEKYGDKLYCFDALVVKGIDVRNRSYEERMEAAKQANLPDITVKTYNPVDSVDALIKYIQTHFKSPTTGHNIDGIILQERKKSYNMARVYKLKLPIMNTIDFRLKHVEGNNFVLYSGGKFVNNSALQFSYPNIENCSLFVAPYYANAHKFTVKELSEKNEYPPEIAKEINALTKEITDNPSGFDGKIVELSWDGSNYYPIRIRTDKEYPNGYRTAVSNIGLVYAPITIENKYFENDKGNPFSEETIGRFHENSHLVRKEIMNRLPELPKEVKRGSCLDLSCGRGGDLKALMDKGYRNLFCVDLDRIALTQLVNSLYMGDYYRHTWVNVFDYDLSGELDTLYNRITERKDYSPGHCFQAVFMNFAIHYVIMNVKTIGDFVNRIIKPGGFFAFTFFDGDKILADNGLAKPVTNSAVDDDSSNDSTEELTVDSMSEDDNAEELESIEDTEELTIEGGAKRKAKKTKGCDGSKTKGGAIHIKRPNRNKKRSTGKLGNLNVDNEEPVKEEEFRPMNNAKQYGEFTIEPFKKGDRWYGRFPLPTIASSGYREEPLVLRKELECLGQDFTEYMNLSSDEYFGLLRLRVYRY